MPMTSDAKSELSKTIRSLRKRLLDDLHTATEGVYRLSLDVKDARLSEAARIKRERLESWVVEQTRALPEKERAGAEERFRHEVEKEAASTLLNRIVFLRLLEASDLRAEKVVTGGWESRGYKDFREFAPELVRDDESEGYAQLLRLIFDDLAIDLPGLYGNVGLTALIPVPAATLRAVVEELDTPQLESCWTDDMTLGWIYQYWNDPVREALDAKLNEGGKVEPHEIASKTQMFTERYMVDWLLQNSLGPMWLAMCKKNGWTPEVETDGTLERLEERRAEWRAKRDAEEVSLTELMPLESEAEQRWAYYVPQPIPDDAIELAIDSVRDLKILDPAVGSGHFLVVAFDLLTALYREEARHRGEEGEHQWSMRAIVERILEHNLNGIDLDPRAVQIAAAALWLKAQQTCTTAQPSQLNLVASKLRLTNLPSDDPSRRELREEVERETGIPAELTQKVVDALAGADHLGSLLKIDTAIDEAIAECEASLTRPELAQGDLYSNEWKDRRISIDADEAKSTLLSRLEIFLQAHCHGDDLGLKLKGEQLVAGVRFIRLVKEGTYDLVIANPPYQGISKLADAKYTTQYPLGKADLYAAFLMRGLQLVRTGGTSAMLTMRNWMFIKQFKDLRLWLLEEFDLRVLGDFDKGAFETMTTSQRISVCLCVFRRSQPNPIGSVAIQPTAPGEKYWSRDRTELKRASVLCQRGYFKFDPTALKAVPDWPLVYWWTQAYLRSYICAPKLGEIAPAKQGLATGDNSRFLRRPFEVSASNKLSRLNSLDYAEWVPYLKGAAGRLWVEPMADIVHWKNGGLEVRAFSRAGRQASRPQNMDLYFKLGVAFSTIGTSFSARIHAYPSIFGHKGSSIFHLNLGNIVCLLNSKKAREVIESLNPGVDFTATDVHRIPLQEVSGAEEILDNLLNSFRVSESHREPSIEFKYPGHSTWRYAQEWAQKAVDRAEGEPLPAFIPERDFEPATAHMSYALGRAIGRFGENGKGILDPSSDDLTSALRAGILFLDGTLEEGAAGDSLTNSAAAILHEKWEAHGPAIGSDLDIRTWLRLRFFSEVHKGMYENRPIYFPLSSQQRTFVAYISIHRWSEGTLRALLAEHLSESLTRLEGEVTDLRKSRQGADKKIASDAERRYDYVIKKIQELADFIALVEQCSEKGPPQPDEKIPSREIDARYDPVLDDGVMINSAAIWPLLEPQWKDPKRWWKELALANPRGNKDYDWSQLAARYFPSRVDKKCQVDPSLGVAHGCFWKYHPENAYKWELRLRDEIAPDFTINEEGSDEARIAFENEYPEKVEELVEAERKRREKNRKKREKESASAGPLFDLSNEKDTVGLAK